MVGRPRAAVNAAMLMMRSLAARVGTRTLVWAALLAALALVLDFVPLFDLLGYDFAFALGLGAALASVDIGQGVVARWRAAVPPVQREAGDAPTTNDSGAARVVLVLVGRGLVLALATLVAPLLFSLANALRVRNCSVGSGLIFFLLLPVGTAIFGATAGVLVGLAAPRRGRLWAFLLPVLSILWTLLRLYRDPAVFAFDPFGGYFPGPIYDEALRPPPRLWMYRLTTLVWIATAVELALAVRLGERDGAPRRWRPWPLHRGLALLAVPLLAASVALFALEGRLGFHIARGDLERVLDRTLRTDHFVLRYSSLVGKTPTELGLQAEDLELRYDQLAHTLGVEPKLPITVWEFPNAETKKEFVGAGHTIYARPWTQEIFLQTERFPSIRLRHEMAHVFAGAFGDPLFGVSLAVRWKGPLPVPTLAVGLIEGVAEAADASNPDGESTIHQEAAAMVQDGRAPPLASVMGAGFSAQSGARAYTIAGSFTAFLLETRGADALRALYRSAGDFEGVYHTPLAALEREWATFLRRQPLDARARARAKEQFRRPAIFKKTCARELAARVAEARLIERTHPPEAVALLEETCRDDPHEPLFHLELARARAAAGDGPGALEILNPLARLGRMGAGGDVTQPLRAQAAHLAAEVYFHMGDVANATASERQALELAANETDRRQAEVRRRALETPIGRQTLARALFGDDPQGHVGAIGGDTVLPFFLVTEYARLMPGDPLGPYMVGRQLLWRDAARALPYLRRACGEGEAAPAAPGTPGLTPDFVRECRRMIADASYRVGDWARARAALDAIIAEATPGEGRPGDEAERLRALDMRSRVDWAAARRQGEVAAPEAPPGAAAR